MKFAVLFAFGVLAFAYGQSALRQGWLFRAGLGFGLFFLAAWATK